MSIDQICEGIVKKVCASNLHFTINQTPYSLYVTIRKKHLKETNSVEAASEISETNREENSKIFGLLKSRTEALEIENNYVKVEYQKLLGYLQHNESELGDLKKELENSHNAEKVSLEALNAKENSFKKLKAESAQNGTKYERACQEIKRLKVEIDSIKKDKNALSVAVKTAKKETKDQAKRADLKIGDYEKKIFELMEYKEEKTAEERNLKLKQRKELKKAKKKHAKNVQEENLVDDIEDHEVEKDLNENIPVFNHFEVLDYVSENSLEALTTTKNNVIKTKIETSKDLKVEKEHNEDLESNQIYEENAEENFSHLKPEEKAFIEQYRKIIEETIANAVAAVETKII